MKNNQPHASEHTLINAIHNFVSNHIVRLMSPPDQYVCLIQARLREPMFRVFKGGGFGSNQFIPAQRINDGAVNSAWINAFDGGVRVFLSSLIPHQYVDSGHAVFSKVSYRRPAIFNLDLSITHHLIAVRFDRYAFRPNNKDNWRPELRHG